MCYLIVQLFRIKCQERLHSLGSLPLCLLASFTSAFYLMSLCQFHHTPASRPPARPYPSSNASPRLLEFPRSDSPAAAENCTFLRGQNPTQGPFFNTCVSIASDPAFVIPALEAVSGCSGINYTQDASLCTVPFLFIFLVSKPCAHCLPLPRLQAHAWTLTCESNPRILVQKPVIALCHKRKKEGFPEHGERSEVELWGLGRIQQAREDQGRGPEAGSTVKSSLVPSFLPPRPFPTLDSSP